MKKRNIAPIKYSGFFILLLFLGLLLSCSIAPSVKSGWGQVPVILKDIVPPSFPERDFSVNAFGAKGDGKADCTEAFKRAIDACHEAGGGRVVVPSGVFLTGAIHLKSNVNLHIEKEATILFSQDLKKYLPTVYTRFEGVEVMNYSPFIYAYEQENLAITGEGMLDGQADSTVWWPWAGKSQYGWNGDKPLHETDRNTLFKMAEEGIPVEKRIFGEGHFLRVSFIQFYKCRNILIENIAVRRSPMWEIHPVRCENVTVQRVRVVSNGPNNDGCNPESCRNVLIKECYFDTGDDCIAIKSGRNMDGRRINVPSENIIVQGCIMKDGHGGVTIGSEMSGGCRNIFVENCTMDSPRLERALRIKTNSLRGGIIENIYMRNVKVGEVSDAVVRIDFHYAEGDVGEHTPIVRKLYINHVTSQKSNYALRLEGYERSPISNVVIESCEFNGVKKGNILNHVDGLRMANVYVNGQKQ